MSDFVLEPMDDDDCPKFCLHGVSLDVACGECEWDEMVDENEKARWDEMVDENEKEDELRRDQ